MFEMLYEKLGRAHYFIGIMRGRSLNGVLFDISEDGRVRRALSDFELRGAPLLAVFEGWEALSELFVFSWPWHG